MPDSPTQPPDGADDALAAAFRGRPAERLPSGRAFAREGEAAADVFLVEAGIGRIQRILRDGRRAIGAFLFPGDVFGLALEETYAFTGEAVQPLVLRRVPRARLYERAAADRVLQHGIVARLRDELAIAQARALVSLHHSAAERLAGFVVALAARQGIALRPDAVVPVPMPRADVADHLGVTVETVCRTLAKLREEGVMRLDGSARVVVLDPEALRRRAGCVPSVSSQRRARPAAGLGLWLPAGTVH
ncbi:MAG: helix-turn-helix domain-containing protein [Salinarimonas sp.]